MLPASLDTLKSGPLKGLWIMMLLWALKLTTKLTGFPARMGAERVLPDPIRPCKFVSEFPKVTDPRVHSVDVTANSACRVPTPAKSKTKRVSLKKAIPSVKNSADSEGGLGSGSRTVVSLLLAATD